MNSFADLILSRIRDRLRNAGKRADALSLKERALLAVSLLLVMLYVWNQWFLSPLEVRRTTLLAERASLSEELSRFDALTTEWAKAAEFDPDAEGKERIGAITQQLTSLSSAIEERAGLARSSRAAEWCHRPRCRRRCDRCSRNSMDCDSKASRACQRAR